MDIDLARAGATTILSCGTTNCGHYVLTQQGLTGEGCKSAGKEVFNELSKYAPPTPGDGWELCAIELLDYKSWHNERFYMVHVEYKFIRDSREKYSCGVDISPTQANVAYEMFRRALNQHRTDKPKESV